MEPLNQKTQEEVAEIIKYLLEPISGEVESFGEPYEMTHRTKYGNEPERSWVEILYPVLIRTKTGEASLSVSSAHINQIEHGVWRACHDFVYTDITSAGDQQEILKRLYSQEFLELRKGKNNL